MEWDDSKAAARKRQFLRACDGYVISLVLLLLTMIGRVGLTIFAGDSVLFLVLNLFLILFFCTTMIMFGMVSLENGAFKRARAMGITGTVIFIIYSILDELDLFSKIELFPNFYLVSSIALIALCCIFLFIAEISVNSGVVLFIKHKEQALSAKYKKASKAEYIVLIIAAIAACLAPIAFVTDNLYPIIVIFTIVGYFEAALLIALFVVFIIKVVLLSKIKKAFKDDSKNQFKGILFGTVLSLAAIFALYIVAGIFKVNYEYYTSLTGYIAVGLSAVASIFWGLKGKQS